jgi:arginase family enzyme
MACGRLGWEWRKFGPHLKPERLVYIALRDVDEHEKTNIRELGIKVDESPATVLWGNPASCRPMHIDS